MLSDIFKELQNKEFYDVRDYPVHLSELYYVDDLNENKKIRLGERVYDFDYIVFYRLVKSSTNITCKLLNLDNFFLIYKMMDLTLECINYDETSTKCTYKIIIHTGEREPIILHYDVYGNIGDSATLVFSSVIGDFVFFVKDFDVGSYVYLTMYVVGNEVLMLDNVNVFVSKKNINYVQFNIANNSIYLNILPYPFDKGNFWVLCKYRGIGSIIRASDLNDIIKIIKYYNLLPKFEVEKINNNDIKLYVKEEFYFLQDHIEKYENQVIQLEDIIFTGFQSALVCFLDVVQNIFTVKRIATSLSYNNLIADITNFHIDNPEYEFPLFILIFDPNKNLFEYAYIKNMFGGSFGSSSNIIKYSYDLTNVVSIDISLNNEKLPHFSLFDNEGYYIIPDEFKISGAMATITFEDSFTGKISLIQ